MTLHTCRIVLSHKIVNIYNTLVLFVCIVMTCTCMLYIVKVLSHKIVNTYNTVSYLYV